MKRRLRPWVKALIAGVISVLIIACANRAVTSFAHSYTEDTQDNSNKFIVRGIITDCSDKECYVDVIDGKNLITQAIVNRDKYYSIGQPISIVINDDRNIINSRLMHDKEMEIFFKKYGNEFREKHDSLFIGE